MSERDTIVNDNKDGHIVHGAHYKSTESIIGSISDGHNALAADNVKAHGHPDSSSNAANHVSTDTEEAQTELKYSLTYPTIAYIPFSY